MVAMWIQCIYESIRVPQSHGATANTVVSLDIIHMLHDPACQFTVSKLCICIIIQGTLNWGHTASSSNTCCSPVNSNI